MLIRPTSIIAHSLIEQDLRQFTHTLNQEQITDTDSIIPITHKGQLTQINRKDLSEGMSPWSAYHRDWLTGFTLDLDYLRQGITRYRDVDDDGVSRFYWFKGSKNLIDQYNSILNRFGTGLQCILKDRYIEIVGYVNRSESIFDAILRSENQTLEQTLSRLLGLIITYGHIQCTNGTCNSIKVNLPITAYTRIQIDVLYSDISRLRAQGLFVHHHLIGSGMKQNLELVTNDPELLQLLLSYLQYIDSSVTMTTFDTLRIRSEQVIQLGLGDVPIIAKPRSLS